MKYLVNIKCADGSCFYASFDVLGEELRDWTAKNGKKGDALVIVRNGDSLANARTIII